MAAVKENQRLKDKIVDILIYAFMVVIIFLTLYPFWYCFVGSFNEGLDYMKGGVYFLPRKFTIGNYMTVFADNTILNSFKVTIARTVIGTISHVLFCSVFAYAYSRKILKWKKFFMVTGLIPMYFGGGLIPTYILYRQLGLLNNFLVYIIPGLFSFYHVIIMQAFFRGIPDSLAESAMMDGASEYRIYWSILLPLSTPVLAAIALFTGVGHWNSYFDSMVFTTSRSLQTVQVYLMKIVRSQQAAQNMVDATQDEFERVITPETVKLATMMTVTLPIIFIYPFLQRYFVKGMMIGSLKG